MGLACAALLAGAGVAVYLVASHSQTTTTIETETVKSATQPSQAQTITTVTEPATTAAPSPEQVAAEQLNGILAFSSAGRTDVQQGNYRGAIANRNEVLQRLEGMSSPDAAMSNAVQLLEQAIQASLSADQAYASDTSATEYNDEATQYKKEFVSAWAPIATQFNLPQYSPDDI